MTGISVVRRSAGTWVDLNQSTTPITPNPQRFPGDPGPGVIMWGQTRQGGPSAMAARAAEYQSLVGAAKPVYPKVFRIYTQPFSSIAAGKTEADQAIADARTVIAWGGMPFITSKELQGQTLAQLAAGSMNAYMDYFMEGLVALNKPMFFDYHQEPVGDPFGGVTADPNNFADVVGLWGQRRDLAGGKNLISVSACIGIGAGPLNTKGAVDPAKCLPWVQALAPVCDVWGTHHYNQTQPYDPDSKWTTNSTMARLVGDFWDVQDSVDNTKARIHGEWGVHVKLNDRTFAGPFMDQFLTYGISRNLVAACFFDSGLNSPNGSWDFDAQIITDLDSMGNPIYTNDTVHERKAAMARELVDPRVVDFAPIPA